jgi:putative transcriptional regulator
LPEKLANDLRAAREVKSLTQAQLAERIGVSRKTINTIENGVFVPSTLIALKLAAALGEPVEALFFLLPE